MHDLKYKKLALEMFHEEKYASDVYQARGYTQFVFGLLFVYKKTLQGTFKGPYLFNSVGCQTHLVNSTTPT